MKNLFCTGLLALAAACLQAQNPSCGTASADLDLLQHRLRSRLDAPPAAAQRAVSYVPLRFHLVADTDGSGRAKLRNVLEALCAVNADFAGSDMQFYLHGADLTDNEINNDLVNESPLSNGAEFIMSIHKDTAAVNIFIVREINNPNSPLFESGYYKTGVNWIAGNQGVLHPDPYLLSHQLGHYFSLIHTFHGWDAPFVPGYPGWPQAPDTVFGPVELMDGSNCTVAGDLICDTPPDYMFIPDDCAPYDGGALDPNGVPVDPMENNMMGYFFGCADYEFTTGQFGAMQTELASPDQAGLDLSFVPPATEIMTPANLLVSPPPVFQFPGNVDIQLDWLDVPGATHYLVELDWSSSFATPYFLEFVTTASDLLVPVPLTPEHTYFWRVRPFNRYVGCATPETGQFRTGAASSAVQTLVDGSVLRIAPNPVSDGQTVRIQLDLKTATTARLLVLDAGGRQIGLENQTFPAGNCAWVLDASTLAPGLNWLKIELNGQSVTQAIFRE